MKVLQLISLTVDTTSIRRNTSVLFDDNMVISHSPIVAPLALTLCPISKPQQYFLEGIIGLFAEV